MSKLLGELYIKELKLNNYTQTVKSGLISGIMHNTLFKKIIANFPEMRILAYDSLKGFWSNIIIKVNTELEYGDFYLSRNIERVLRNQKYNPEYQNNIFCLFSMLAYKPENAEPFEWIDVNEIKNELFRISNSNISILNFSLFQVSQILIANPIVHSYVMKEYTNELVQLVNKFLATGEISSNNTSQLKPEKYLLFKIHNHWASYLKNEFKTVSILNITESCIKYEEIKFFSLSFNFRNTIANYISDNYTLMLLETQKKTIENTLSGFFGRTFKKVEWEQLSKID
jgi:hypothetical protein